MAKRKSEKELSQDGKFPKRVRFNWGFWDGLNDKERGQIAKWYRGAHSDYGHYDLSYSAGYCAGLWWREARPQTSDIAWEVHCA